ncbi:IclR family transcriptional regulator [Variovorax sp. E3]|uniref:IclR family transcriptional regulator n=1 Tax=Variovorax sp. E3 TaxID=1914993 RepID=UPI0018DC653C|nr:IclR family transcriptional regulator [Variovorax sp. E3]
MKALSNALKVYNAFTTNRGRWSVTGLCEHTGLTKSHVSRILAEFRDAGLLIQDPDTREYTVGLPAITLAGHFLGSQPLVREAVGPMRRLAAELDHTAVLGVLNEGQVLHLLEVQGAHFTDVGMRVGMVVPAHATAIGKVLFAFSGSNGELILPEGEYSRFTPNTITTRRDLTAELRQVRKEGVARTEGETVVGLGATAVPILERGERIAGAIGLVFPRHTVNAKDRDAHIKRLQGAAREISGRLGAVVYPFGGL